MENINVIKSKNHKTSEWSGGTTTELYIYPSESEYIKKNFKFRLSSARVYEEESTFTILPKIDRKLMVLEGELLLQHENHHTIKLKEFDQDSFCGDWKTKSLGKARDFNLMTSEGCTGTLEHIHIKSNNKKCIKIDSKNEIYEKSTYVIFVVSGTLDISFSDQYDSINLEPDDLVILDTKIKEIELTNKDYNNVDIVISKIYYN